MTGTVDYLPIIVGVLAFVFICLFFLGVFRLLWERAKKNALIGKIRDSAQSSSAMDAANFVLPCVARNAARA